ncbi:MAG: DUF350 domain-containing protein [Alphaproteobacteria bacterium]|nr:DUF350 domain-containing protein [Alphaproteobacteria bacterium]
MPPTIVLHGNYLATLPAFALFFAVGLVLTAVFVLVYLRVTPYAEIEAIRQGNTAAAVSLAGAVLGFLLPLGSAIVNSHHVEDMAAWGAVALVVQIALYLIAKRAWPWLAEGVAQGRVAAATLLATLSVGVGILNAACMAF